MFAQEDKKGNRGFPVTFGGFRSPSGVFGHLRTISDDLAGIFGYLRLHSAVFAKAEQPERNRKLPIVLFGHFRDRRRVPNIYEFSRRWKNVVKTSQTDFLWVFQNILIKNKLIFANRAKITFSRLSERAKSSSDFPQRHKFK